MVEKKVEAGKKDDGSIFIFSLDMHCEGCAIKLKKFVKRFPGVERVKTDCETNKLTVKGKVDAAKLRDSLAEKTSKKVELITPLPKKEEKKSDEKVVEKPKTVESENPKKETEKVKDDKKQEKKGEEEIKKGEEKKVALVVEAPKMDVNKMQNYGYQVGPSAPYWFMDGQMYNNNYAMSGGGYYGHNVAALPSPKPIQSQNMGYAPYAMEQMYHVQPHSYAYNAHAPQMFSDENPNACSVM